MKDTLNLIPQVFYDLIGRIAPATTILVLGAILLPVDANVDATVRVLKQLPTAVISILFLAGALAVYVAGVVLGAIGSVLEDRLKQPSFSEIRKSKPFSDLQEADIPYIYDYILIHNPAVGARLAKLRAESHMCGSLIAGLLILAVAYTSVNWDEMSRNQYLVLVGLITSAIAMFLFQGHLKTRGWKLQVNCWMILRDQEQR